MRRGLPELFIALRYLWGRAGEGGRYLRGAAAGIALSLIPIVVTLIVADGMIRGITDRYIELGTGHLQFYDFADPEGNVDEEALALETMKGALIRGVWRERQGLGLILGKNGKTGATVRAIDGSFWTDPGSASFLKVISGSEILENNRELLLGQALAENVGASPGDKIRLLTLKRGELGGTAPRVTVFTVKGIISSGYRELDSLWCIMNYSAGEEILSPQLYRSFLLVKIDNPYVNTENTVLALTQIFGPGAGIFSWMNLQRSLYSSFESTRQMLLFIMAILVLVAAVNVSSATSMLVIERRRDIAVLKAFGTSPGGISAVFLLSSLLTGICGAAVGIGAGLAIGSFINPIIRTLEKILSFIASPWHASVRILDPDYYLETIPIVVDVKMIFLIAVFTILCSVAASALPALKAGKLKPLDILQKI